MKRLKTNRMIKEIEKGGIFRDKLEAGRKSPLKTYMELSIGGTSLYQLFKYEFITCLLGPMPGGFGLLMRKIFYSRLVKKAGKGLIIGRNVVIRHPDKITFGDNVTIDDNCLVDARGAGADGILFEDGVIINRNCMIQAKSGSIRLGRRTSIGSNSVLVSMDGIEIEESVLMAGGCCISAGLYHVDDMEKPIMDQGIYTKDPVRIGRGSWLGTGITVLDGVTIGCGAILGAGSLANKDIPDYAVAFGVPAKVKKTRQAK